jgi:hypothetical protein
VKIVAWFARSIEIGDVKAMSSPVLRRHQPPASSYDPEQRRKDCGK